MFSRKNKADCKKAQGMLSEYLDEILSEHDCLFVEQHLDACDVCSKEYSSLHTTVNLLQRIPVLDTPRSFALRESDIVEPAIKHLFEPNRWGWLRPAAALAAIVLVVLISVDFLVINNGAPAYEGVDSNKLLMSTDGEEGSEGLKEGAGFYLSSTPELDDQTAEELRANETEWDIDIGGTIMPAATAANITVSANKTVVPVDGYNQFGEGNITGNNTLGIGNGTEMGNVTGIITGNEKLLEQDIIEDTSARGTQVSADDNRSILRVTEIILGIILIMLIAVFVFGRLRNKGVFRM